MPLAKEKKQEVIKTYQTKEGDNGSSEVQIAILTERINQISEHLKANKKDNHTRRGLLLMVSRRKKLLNYLSRKNNDSYKKLVKALGIRQVEQSQ